MKKICLMLRRCKTLSRQLGRTLSYSSLRSKSIRDHYYQESWSVDGDVHACGETCQTVFVGSSKRRYVISSRYMDHPLVNALIEKSRGRMGQDGYSGIYVKCEVVLFDHLLWMLKTADPSLISDSLEELAELYVL